MRTEEEWATSSAEAKWDDDSFLRSKTEDTTDKWKTDDPW
jgi:hypothetical protein